MKQIMDFCISFSLDGKTWKNTTIWQHLNYVEPGEPEIHALDTFDKLFDFVTSGGIPNAYTGYTIFKRRPIVRLSSALDDFQTKITEQNFRPIYVKYEYQPVKIKWTVAQLMKNLPAEDFTEWFNDNRLTTRPAGRRIY